MRLEIITQGLSKSSFEGKQQLVQTKDLNNALPDGTVIRKEPGIRKTEIKWKTSVFQVPPFPPPIKLVRMHGPLETNWIARLGLPDCLIRHTQKFQALFQEFRHYFKTLNSA